MVEVIEALNGLSWPAALVIIVFIVAVVAWLRY